MGAVYYVWYYTLDVSSEEMLGIINNPRQTVDSAEEI